MAWVLLILAGLFEALGVAMINQFSQKRNWPSIIFLIFGFGSSLGLLSYSFQYIPMGTAYALWTGIGVAGGTLAGMAFFGESRDWRRILFISMILVGAVGLKMIS